MRSIGKMEALTRAGFAARGVMYVLIGFLALRSGRTEDGAGAMRFLEGGLGTPLLLAMALGFLGYGLWRLSEAAIDSEGHGSGPKGMAIRAGGAASGLVHLALAFIAAKLALGDGGGGSGGAREGAAAALDLPGGWLLMAALAAALAAVGAYQLVKALKAEFLRTLESGAASRSWVLWLGRAGYAARGIVFLVMAWFFWKSAMEARASEAGGMGEALGSLPGDIRTAVALGLLLFGLFSFVEARYRRIRDPRVAERMKSLG